MNFEEATRLTQRHEDACDNYFERYAHLFADDYQGNRPNRGTRSGKAEMYALERRATAACPDRKTKVLRVLAGEGSWFGVEELRTGTNTGDDEMFDPQGTIRSTLSAFTKVNRGKFTRAVAWTGRPARQGGTSP